MRILQTKSQRPRVFSPEMKSSRRIMLLTGMLSGILLLVGLYGPARISTTRAQATHTFLSFAAREDAYRSNNLGVALMEQFKYKEAAEAFTRALQQDPKLALARINLCIALYNVPDLTGAQREAEVAIAQSPTAPQPHYILGLIAKTQNRTEDAITAFQRVLKLDPDDVGANINLGQLLSQQRKYTEAVTAFRTALAVEPYNTTAVYNLATALTRSSQREEGQRMIQRFQELRQRGSGTVIGTNYLEQGRYAEALASTGAEPELVEKATPAVSFRDVTTEMLPKMDAADDAGATQYPSIIGSRFKTAELNDAMKREIVKSLGGVVTPFDMDADGDLDLLVVTPLGQQLYRNDGGKFTDITAQSGALSIRIGGTGAVAGDYDNDGRADLFIVRSGSLSLYHNEGGGKFTDATRAAALPDYPYLSTTAAFVDVDHDGDLDIFVAGLADLSKPPATNRPTIVFPGDFAGAPNLLLRNDGNGKFTDVTASAKVSPAPGHALAIVPTDYNNTRDVDLLVLNYGAPQSLFSNQRDGSFKDVARDVGLNLEGRWTAVAAGDVNKDGFTDFFFGRANAPGLFAVSDGRGKFKTYFAPPETEGATAAQFLDYDNDGLLDCVLLFSSGLRVLRNTGGPLASWANTTERAAQGALLRMEKAAAGRLFASGDLDGDGDTDLAGLDGMGQLRLARNEGGNLNRSLRVNLTGRVSNKSGVGAKIEARAGSLVQKLESYSASPAPAPADIIFGLGQRSAADAVRVLWPAGIVQAETEIPAAQNANARNADLKRVGPTTLPVTELDRKPSSCPYLYAWNGERFEFITDFMGGGEMGYLEEPGRYNVPDPTEYVRIRGDQLQERDGRYELRVTNELEEAMFVDRLQLIAVAHPTGTEVYPNEGMIDPPLPPFKLYSTQGARPPLAATDDAGRDVLARITKMDRQYPDCFALERIRGYSAEHTLTLKLSEEQKDKHARMLLLLTGWTDYAWSSDNVAASQAGKEMKPPALQVRDEQGRWRTVIENIGIPVGRPQTMTVDLTGRFLTANREVRIVTSMRVYWDQILVDTSNGDAPVKMTRLDPVRAELRWRGYSREVSPDGREPYGYDYEQVSYASPWKVMTGRYTREGDVRELLLKTDDMFVISRTGDELSLSFDARQLPALPDGWTRTFLLYADGFSKEMDINSASPDQLSPLPFHGMKRYPYGPGQAYPMTNERRAYMERYNTRVVAAQVPSIDTALLDLKKK